jgi:hypothetical protein
VEEPPELDESARYDTGRGYAIVVPTGADPASASFLGQLPPGITRQSSLLSAVVYGLSRFTFNALLLGIILAILAIPTAIGLIRLINSSAASLATRTQPTATPRPVPTAYPGYQTFRAGAYTIAFPSAWTHTGSSSTITTPDATAPLAIPEDRFSGPTNVSLVVGATPLVADDQLQPILDGVAGAYQSGSGTSNFQTVAPARAGPTLDGQPSLLEKFTFVQFVRTQSVTFEGEALIANPQRGSYTCVLVFLAPQAQFAGLRTQYLAPMLASFRFAP